MISLGKKSDKKAKLAGEEIEQLKQQLHEKMGECKAISPRLVEAGDTELPNELLETVTGGIIPQQPSMGYSTPSSKSSLYR